jgi:LmbE family N-acetylglucosaminyl deacetylase
VADALTVLHLAPHPDDEVIGAPATLLRLRDAGHRIVNVACSLGRPDEQERRRSEAIEACLRAGFDLEILDPPLKISRDDDLQLAQRTLTEEIQRLVQTLDVALVVGPTPHDGHHGHEVVGRAARDALAMDRAPRLWMWAIWADLPLPTLFAAFGEEELARATHALRAHAGEVVRNDYVDLLGCRGITARVLGAEQVFGFGHPGKDVRYADLLTEVAYSDGEWWAGAPREPDPSNPLAWMPRDRPLGWWMNEPSFRARLRDVAASGPGVAPSTSS